MEVSLEPRRLLQTTLVHPLRPEFSVSALFVGAVFSKDTDIDGIDAALGIAPISSGTISEAELKRILVCIFSENFAVFDMGERAFGAFVGETDIDMEFLDQVIHRDFIVVERGALQSASLAGLLNDAVGATLGFFPVPERARHHDISGSPNIELLTIVVPYGVLACGSQRGLGRALNFGLYERLHHSLAR